MRASIAKGAAWMVLFRLIDRSIGIVSTAVLARLLLPADFGLVAMAMSIIAIIELASTFSFEMALIQKAEPSRAHYDTAWTLNVLAGCAGGAAIALATWPTASFYGDARLIPIMLVLAAAWCLSGSENVGTVDFRREMNFSKEFKLMFVRRIVAFTATMVAALTFLNPHVYLDTVVLLGSLSGRHAGEARVAFGLGAMLASGVWFYTLGFGARLLAPLFARPVAWQILDVLIGLVMLSIAASLLWQAWG